MPSSKPLLQSSRWTCPNQQSAEPAEPYILGSRSRCWTCHAGNIHDYPAIIPGITISHEAPSAVNSELRPITKTGRKVKAEGFEMASPRLQQSDPALEDRCRLNGIEDTGRVAAHAHPEQSRRRNPPDHRPPRQRPHAPREHARGDQGGDRGGMPRHRDGFARVQRRGCGSVSCMSSGSETGRRLRDTGSNARTVLRRQESRLRLRLGVSPDPGDGARAQVSHSATVRAAGVFGTAGTGAYLGSAGHQGMSC